WQPYGGMTPLVWQYTDRLQFNGMLLDFNAFRGSFAGKQDPASVTACLAEFKAFATTGAPPPHGPYLHEVRPGDPAQSFAALAASRGMTVDRLAQIARGVLAGKDLAIFNAYLALDAALTAAGRPHPVMPAGFVWVSVNPSAPGPRAARSAGQLALRGVSPARCSPTRSSGSRGCSRASASRSQQSSPARRARRCRTTSGTGSRCATTRGRCRSLRDGAPG